MWYLALIPYKKQIAVSLVVLIVAIVIYFSVKALFDSESDPEKVPLPGDEPDGALSSTEAATVINTALALHQDMDGLAYFHDLDIYKTYASFSDTLFVAVYNEFNAMYFDEDEGTLRKWINGEALGHIQSTIDTIMLRMDKLGLV